MELKINQKFKELIPPLTAEEFEQLETNCLNEGIRDKIVTWNGYIIDGHNRYEIATRHGLEFATTEAEYSTEEEVIEWMIFNQFGRRNLSIYQRGVLALELEDLFKEKARENLSKSGGDKKSGLTNSSNPIIKKVNTRKELAKAASVGEQTIERVKILKKKAAPEIKQKLQTGEMSINQAYQEIKKEEKIEERKQYIEKQKQDIENSSFVAPDGLFDVIAVDPPWNYGREYDPNGSRVANPYPEMTQSELLEIELPSKKDCVLFLWTTHQFIWDAKELMDKWGFTYKATIVWDKEKIGMGAWLRMQCEFCLVGVKGKPFFNNTKHRDIIREPRREHSRKPDQFYDIVEDITAGRRLEYFSREKRDKWEVFGNETDKF